MLVLQIKNEPVTLRGLRETRDVAAAKTNIPARVHHDFIMIASWVLHWLHDDNCSGQGLEPVTSMVCVKHALSAELREAFPCNFNASSSRFLHEFCTMAMRHMQMWHVNPMFCMCRMVDRHRVSPTSKNWYCGKRAFIRQIAVLLSERGSFSFKEIIESS